MSYKIAFKKSVSRDPKKIDIDQADKVLKKIEEYLPENAGRFPMLTGKFAGLRNFRGGDYRVIYTVIEDTGLILRISHRSPTDRDISTLPYRWAFALSCQNGIAGGS